MDRLNYDANEPTMSEKLASLNILDADKSKSTTKQVVSSETKPPSADSVYVLLKQALHADDHALLLDCLYTQDEKLAGNCQLNRAVKPIRCPQAFDLPLTDDPVKGCGISLCHFMAKKITPSTREWHNVPGIFSTHPQRSIPGGSGQG